MATASRKPAGRAQGATIARSLQKPPGRAGANKAAGPRLVTLDPAAQLREWVDELGRLDSELVEIRPKLKRVDTLRDLIRERYEGEAAASGFDARGAEYFATLGPRAFEASVDYAAVQQEIGLTAYAAIARPTLKALEENLTPAVLARVVTRGYTGARPVKTFRLGKTK